LGKTDADPLPYIVPDTYPSTFIINCQMRKMRIAVIGTKGVPAKWGGIEKYIEEVGQRLVLRGHEVTVFGSRWFLRDYRESTYKGMRIRRMPALDLHATDALSNAFFAAMRIAVGEYEIANFHGYASYYFVPLLRTVGKRTVVTAHGVESGWDNPKYGWFAKSTIRLALGLGIRKANSVATVAEHLRARIRDAYKRDVQVLPSGLDKVSPQPPRLIREKYGLQGGDYVLFLGRIDPIKRVDWLLDLSGVLDDDIRFVIAGGAQNEATRTYLDSLRQRASANSKVLFTGPVHGCEKAELLSNCLSFLAPSQDEGLPITVLEAMAYGRCCVASDIPAHREVIKDGITGSLFPRDDREGFLQKVGEVLESIHSGREVVDHRARAETLERFDWERTTHDTEKLFEMVLNEGSSN
jgi:glycosyltransferase involved in cell wall biosynthesis